MPCPKEPGAVKRLAAGGRGTRGVGPSLGSTTRQDAHSGFLAGVPMGGDRGCGEDGSRLLPSGGSSHQLGRQKQGDTG